MRIVARWAVPSFAAAYLAITLAGPQPTRDQLHSYAAVSVAAHAAVLIAGLALVAAGLIVWFEPGRRRTAFAAVLAGMVWFAPEWEGWSGGPEAVRSLGAVATPFLLALLVDLVVSVARPRPRRRAVRVAVAAVYALAGVTSAGLAFLRAPYLDPSCWRNCLGNTFLVHSDPQVAEAVTNVWQRASILIGVALVIIVTLRLRHDRGARSAFLPVIVGAGLAGAAEAGYASVLAYGPVEDPRDALFSSIFFARAGALTLLALGLVWTVAHAHRVRGALARFAAELDEAPQPGKLEAALADAVGDPTLEVAYWVTSASGYVDASGRPTEPPRARPGRSVTPIVRADEQIALVGHDSALVAGHELAEQLGSKARMAVDSERLQAEILGQLDNLRASRARIVEASDAERRRLERNLHDAAQQRLLAVSYELKLATSAARADGDDDVASMLEKASHEVGDAIVGLRALAQGIYPAALPEAGIAPALERLADSTPIVVELVGLPDARFPLTSETAAYVTVAEAVRDAVTRSASFLSVRVEVVDQRLIVTAHDDGDVRSSSLTHVADRVGALGGSLVLEGTSLRAEIPCV